MSANAAICRDSDVPESSPQCLIRSPRVDRLTCSSAAAFDLFPWLASSAHRIRLASTSLNRSSSEIVPVAGTASTGTSGSDVFWRPRNRMLAATHPTRTVPHVFVWAMRSQVFSSSRTLPGHAYAVNACTTAGEMAGIGSPRARKNRPTKASSRTGMSSRRSRSGGSVSGNTFRR